MLGVVPVVKFVLGRTADIHRRNQYAFCHDVPLVSISRAAINRDHRAAGDARNAMTSATADGATQLLKSASGIALRLAGVSSTDGATALIQISSPAVSWASASVIAATAALAVA